MSDHLITFLFTAGAATWLFTKLQNRSGYNTSQSVIATAVAAGFLYVVLYSILSLML